MEQFTLLLAFSLLLHTRWSFVHRKQCSFNVRSRYANKPLTLDRVINFNTSGGTLPSSIGNFTKITSIYIINSNNTLNPVIGTVPAELGKLTTLFALYQFQIGWFFNKFLEILVVTH